jgi:hypothetical protein
MRSESRASLCEVGALERSLAVCAARDDTRYDVGLPERMAH